MKYPKSTKDLGDQCPKKTNFIQPVEHTVKSAIKFLQGMV